MHTYSHQSSSSASVQSIMSHSKMGVMKKIKRALSFKKDKKDKGSKQKIGDSHSTVTERVPSDSDILNTDKSAQGKDGKKRSWSLRSLARKPSFGKKDGKKKNMNGNVSPDSTIDDLSVIMVPLAATSPYLEVSPEQDNAEPDTENVFVNQVDETVQPAEDQQVPDSKKNTERCNEDTELCNEPDVPTAVDEEQDNTRENQPKALEVVKVPEWTVNPPPERASDAPVSDTVKTSSDQEFTAKRDSAEPHTITDVINLLEEKTQRHDVTDKGEDHLDCSDRIATATPLTSDGVTVASTDVDTFSSGPVCSSSSETPKQPPLSTSCSQNGTANGSVNGSVNGVAKPSANGQLKTSPAGDDKTMGAVAKPSVLLSPPSALKGSEGRPSRVWRAWVAILVGLVGVAVAVAVAVGRIDIHAGRRIE